MLASSHPLDAATGAARVSKAILVLLAIIVLLPLWFLATGSLTDIKGVMVMPPNLLPARPSLDNYAYFLTQPLGRWVMNTVILAVGSALASVLVSCATGYAFAFFEFPLKNALWALLLVGIMIPYLSMMIPRFVVLRKLGLLSTLWGLMLSGMLNPVGIYLARAYFLTVPKSILDSARIDGAREGQILMRIIMPISRPIVTCLALFAEIGAMGNYVWQLLVLQRSEKYTLLLGLLRWINADQAGNLQFTLNPLGRKFAASMILIVPILLIFLATSRYFTSALGGALKE